MVTVQPAFYELGDNYIKFGDGAQALVKCAEFKPNTDACIRIAPVTHTYTSAGTYIAKQVPTDTQTGKDDYVYASATVTATTNAGSFSATPTTGAAPLKVQFTSIYYATHDSSESQYYVNFGDGTKDLEKITCIKSNGAADLSSYRCLQWGVSHVYNSGTYKAELIKKVGSKATVLSTLPIVVSGSNAGDVQTKSFSATPTTGAAPLTVSFKVPYRSAGGDYFSFGDGTTGCAVPGTTNDYMTGCGVPINTTFTHTYTQPGTYKVIHSRLGPSTILGTATITVGQN
jgi:PKD repeat protein